METAKLNLSTYREIVENIAEAVVLLVGDDAKYDDKVDQADRSIQATGLLAREPATVLALANNWDAFWVEYTEEEADDLIREMDGQGDLFKLMAYYAFQTDVMVEINLIVNTLDTPSLIPYTE